jgi:hypothetical protein
LTNTASGWGGVEPIGKLLQLVPSGYGRLLPGNAIPHGAAPGRAEMNF